MHSRGTSRLISFYGMRDDFQRYYCRATPEGTEGGDEVHLDFHGDNPVSADDLKKSLYVRSAYRHDPSFQHTTIEQQKSVLDRHAVRRLLDTDQTVQNNYQRIIWRLIGQVTTPGLQTDQIMADTIGDLQESMAHVFGDIQLDALVAVQGTGTFTFTKGMSRNFLYENLSAGEKAAFDLLLDVVVNKAAFNDSLYCVGRTANRETTINRRSSNQRHQITRSGCGIIRWPWATWRGCWRPTTSSSARVPRKAMIRRSTSPATTAFLRGSFHGHALSQSAVRRRSRSAWATFFLSWSESSAARRLSDFEIGTT